MSNEVIVYIVGMFATFSFLYWLIEDEPAIVLYLLAMIWPITVPFSLAFLPFYGLSKLMDRLRN